MQMETVFDKEKSCLNCPDRTACCHSTCEFYKRRSEENARKREARNADREYYQYKNASNFERQKHIKDHKGIHFSYKRK